jgi:serine/threonine protein phosphatase PrpC
MAPVQCAGDSRAVLCRGGVAIPLTDDHKAAREDETVSNSLIEQCLSHAVLCDS